jgi:steroid 5-alpha reductase family enzyme
MDLYNQKNKSYPQKIVLTVLEIVIILISYWILFANGYNKIFHPVNPVTGNYIKRRMPWEEAFSIPFAFALYYIGFALFGYKSDLQIGPVEIIAMLLFLFGSFINTGSELSRDIWKRKPENKGCLYTVGLFKYSMHINYFGDLLWVSAYALLTRNWYSISVPIFLFCFFAFYNIPKLDAYLKSKYGGQFEEYQRKTKKFIPFIY